MSWIPLNSPYMFHGSHCRLRGPPLWIPLYRLHGPLIDFMDHHIDLMDSPIDSPDRFHGSLVGCMDPFIDFLDPHIDFIDPLIDFPYRYHGSPF